MLVPLRPLMEAAEKYNYAQGAFNVNAVAQAKTFAEACHITGIVLTKLDGTAKGGVVISIAADLGVPVRYIGVGEGLDDLQPFDPEAFVAGIL